MNSLEQYKASKHKAKQTDRIKWRKEQQKKYEYDVEDSEGTEFMTKRGIQKSVVGYKPFLFPLLRFGKFGAASKNFLPAQMRREMGNVTHEAGVSCYVGHQYKNGFTFSLPHPDRAAYDVTSWSFRLSDNYLKALWDYIKHKKPMDIFLLKGHLVSYGKANDWLALGSDGEYLLNTAKPYHQEVLSPENVYPAENYNLIEYIIKFYFRNDIDNLRKYIDEDS